MEEILVVLAIPHVGMTVFGILGLLVGSFLNVVIYRYNTGATIGGRSMCLSCGKQLVWSELVPVFSYLLQGGACRGCRAKISVQYPLVELVTGLLFALAFWKFGISPTLVYFLLQIVFLIVITVYDIRHKIIPDLFVYLFIGLSLAYAGYMNFFVLDTPHWLDVLAGPLYFLPFAAMWWFSKGLWMGFGDAKLALGIGWFLGLTGGFYALAIAFWSGALFGLLLMGISRLVARGKHVTMKSEVPFGPFLIFGTLAVVFLDATIEAFFANIALLMIGW